MKDKKNLICKVIFTLLSVSIISFIFINSSLDASESTVQSTGVREFVNLIIKTLGLSFQFTEHFVRKCAHFAEYFALSVSLFFMFISYLKKHTRILISTLLTGLLTACVDEIIQLFSSGRSAQFSDIMLDFSGVLIAACLLYIVILKFKKRSKFNYE